ncbi:hypothetical protein SNEBB_008042 [Seison nebaliae]|nr:hypothetical protein SNEBB_008042 [Seison nebaliae]
MEYKKLFQDCRTSNTNKISDVISKKENLCEESIDEISNCLLHYIGANGNVELYNLLKERNWMIENDFGWTPFFQACRNGQRDFVKIMLHDNPQLLYKKCNVITGAICSVECAFQSRDINICELLLQRINCENNLEEFLGEYGKSLLSLSIYLEFKEGTKLIANYLKQIINLNEKKINFKNVSSITYSPILEFLSENSLISPISFTFVEVEGNKFYSINSLFDQLSLNDYQYLLKYNSIQNSSAFLFNYEMKKNFEVIELLLSLVGENELKRLSKLLQSQYLQLSNLPISIDDFPQKLKKKLKFNDSTPYFTKFFTISNLLAFIGAFDLVKWLSKQLPESVKHPVNFHPANQTIILSIIGNRTKITNFLKINFYSEDESILTEELQQFLSFDTIKYIKNSFEK